MTQNPPSDHPHVPVLIEEALKALALAKGDIAIDCTLGAGGHCSRLVAAVGATGEPASGRVIGLDRDESALALVARRLAAPLATGHLSLVHAAFSDVGRVAMEQGVHGKVSGILADIGVSSMHLDEAERGFSFMANGPLDMRMDQSCGQTAAELLASADVGELTRIFRNYGEEPQARHIARTIEKARAEAPLTTTAELARLVEKALPYAKKSKKHPATKVFQALRIAVNGELDELDQMLDAAFDALAPGGRLAVISFHSLEDRIVKERFIRWTGRTARAAIPRDLPLSAQSIARLVPARAALHVPFPTAPSDQEVALNPRARSAKLRVVTKLTEATP